MVAASAVVVKRDEPQPNKTCPFLEILRGLYSWIDIHSYPSLVATNRRLSMSGSNKKKGVQNYIDMQYGKNKEIGKTSIYV